MVKIHEEGFLNLKCELFQTKHFPVLAKNSGKPWMKLKFSFAIFQILGYLGCQGWIIMLKK
jgi:hypothetical protein